MCMFAPGNKRKEPRSNDLNLTFIYSLVVVSLTTLLDILKVVEQGLIKKQKQNCSYVLREETLCVHLALVITLDHRRAEYPICCI